MLVSSMKITCCLHNIRMPRSSKCRTPKRLAVNDSVSKITTNWEEIFHLRKPMVFYFKSNTIRRVFSTMNLLSMADFEGGFSGVAITPLV